MNFANLHFVLRHISIKRAWKTIEIANGIVNETHSPRRVVPNVAVLMTSAATAANVDLVAAVPVVPNAVLRLRRVRRGGSPAAHPSPVLVQHPTLPTPPASAG